MKENDSLDAGHTTRDDEEKIEFAAMMKRAIAPIHQIALNQGYEIWFPPDFKRIIVSALQSVLKMRR